MPVRDLTACVAALTAVFALVVASAQAQPSTRPDAPAAPRISPDLISRADALKLVLASIDACNTIGEHPTATVFDVSGYQRALLSDDQGPTSGLTVARKAQAALALLAPSKEVAERAKTDPAFAAQNTKDGQAALGRGVVPLYRGGKLVGVLALGGGHDKDEQCATATVKGSPWAGSGTTGKP